MFEMAAAIRTTGDRAGNASWSGEAPFSSESSFNGRVEGEPNLFEVASGPRDGSGAGKKVGRDRCKAACSRGNAEVHLLLPPASKGVFCEELDSEVSGLEAKRNETGLRTQIKSLGGKAKLMHTCMPMTKAEAMYSTNTHVLSSMPLLLPNSKETSI
jgi:hypothetical protein